MHIACATIGANEAVDDLIQVIFSSRQKSTIPLGSVVASFRVEVEECLDNVNPEMLLSLRAQLGLHVGVFAVLVILTQAAADQCRHWSLVIAAYTCL